MAVTINTTALDVVQRAMYQLRQDVDIPTTVTDASRATNIIWKKCKAGLETAVNEVVDSLEWSEKPSRTDLSDWSPMLLNALVYCTARELAVPIAGRQGDMQNMHALYQDKLRQAKLAELNARLSECDDDTVKEVYASLRAVFGQDDNKIPLSIDRLTAQIAAVEDTCLDEILSSHGWTSDVTGQLGVVLNALKGV